MKTVTDDLIKSWQAVVDRLHDAKPNTDQYGYRSAIEKCIDELQAMQSHPSPMSAEQYSSGAIHSLGEFQTVNSMSAEQVEDCRKNAEENYLTTPISVLRYIAELEMSTSSVKADGCEHDCVAKDMFWKKCNKCGMILPVTS